MGSEDLWEYVAHAIRDKRLQMGLTVEELSRLVSVSEERLLCFEQDTKGMDLETFVNISAVLQLDVISLFSRFPLAGKFVFSNGARNQKQGLLQ